MNYNDLPYCDGANCNRKNECRLHIIDDSAARQYIDFSMMASGTMTTGSSAVEYYCGNNGEYKLFQYGTVVNVYQRMWNEMKTAIYDKMSSCDEGSLYRYREILNEITQIERKYGKNEV